MILTPLRKDKLRGTDFYFPSHLFCQGDNRLHTAHRFNDERALTFSLRAKGSIVACYNIYP